jgi:hypothetical protein
MDPKDPIDAVTHLDPYPYYERLLSGPPLQYDGRLKVWIASRAGIVSEILGRQAWRVRPSNRTARAEYPAVRRRKYEH